MNFGNYRMLACTISAYEVCIIWWKRIAICIFQCKWPSRRPDGLTTLEWCSPRSDPFSVHQGISICAEPCGMWNSSTNSLFTQILQRSKNDFEIKLNLTYQDQSNPKAIGILTEIFSTSVTNLLVLACIGDELSRGQVENGVNVVFQVKFDFEGQNQSPRKATWVWTKSFTH